MGRMREKWTEQQESQPGSISEIGPEDLPQAVRFHRKKSNLTQNELAKLASVGKTVIFDIEKGKKTIRLETLMKVLRVLNITVIFQSPLMEIYLRKKYEKS